MTKILILLLLLLNFYFFSCSAPQVICYNIKDYGAENDGKTICTEAFNKAIVACSENGGGIVYIPPGTYRCGTILMKDNVELHFENGSILLASSKHQDFPCQKQTKYRSQKDPGGWYAMIYAEGVSNIAITGLGTIDGNGAQQAPRLGTLGDDRDGRPRNILFISCKNVRIEGIKMRNSGMWCQHYLNCEDVLVDKIEVYNHSNRNNDAIDIDGCRRFRLSNSVLDSDDDAVTLKSTGIAPCESVVVTNCVISSFCNAIKAGTESTGGFRNINISNCIIKPSRCTTDPVFKTARHGITGISLEIVDGGIMEGVSISNITIEGTECPLYIRLGNRARKHTENVLEPPVGIIRNISLSNVIAYNTGNFSSSITAFPGHFIENVMVENVQFFNQGGVQSDQYIVNHQNVKEDEKGYPQPTAWGNLPSSVLFIRHVKGLTISNLIFGSRELDPRVPIIAVDVKNLRIGKGTYVGSSSPESYVLLDNVYEYDIEKPLSWKRTVIKNQ